jgi:hypothetical protein
MKRSLLIAGVAMVFPTLGHAQEDPMIQFDAGGTVRARGEVYDGRSFGLTGSGDDDYILWRVLTHAQLRSDDAWTAHLELGWHEQSGRDRAPAPTDQGRPDIRQAFVDVRLWDRTRIKIGRQELSFGTSRLVSTRDGPNLRRVFDGAKATQGRDAWQATVFLVRPVEDRTGAFDDQADSDQLFGGVYLTRTAGKKGLDLYYLMLNREDARFGAETGRERRHSVGMRLFGQSGLLDYNLEAVAQAGKFGAKDIRAWTVASDLGATISKAHSSPRLGLKVNVTSGDPDPTDDRLGTFNPLFPNLAYFNDAALLAPQNHIDLHPSLTLSLDPRFQVSTGADWFWKTVRADDVYRGPGLPVGARGGSRSIGRQLHLSMRWRPTDAVEIKAGFVRFDVGRALRDVGGQDTNYAMFSTQSRF